jgi:DNA-binding XRE family transcriptional regulator
MNHKRYVAMNSALLIDARQRNGLSIERAAKVARISKNTWLSAEKGNRIFLQTVKLICDAFELNPDHAIIVTSSGEAYEGNCHCEGPDTITVKIVLHDAPPETKFGELVMGLSEYLKSRGIDSVTITDGSIGSFHASLQMTQEEAKRFLSGLERLPNGEYVMPQSLLNCHCLEATTDDAIQKPPSYPMLSSSRYLAIKLSSVVKVKTISLRNRDNYPYFLRTRTLACAALVIVALIPIPIPHKGSSQ